MVTRSPLSAWLISMASAAGASRNGAIASPISNASPSTKRAAATLPSRYFAAMSPRAGVKRGSCIAIPEQSEDGARDLAFAAFGAAWPRLRCPGEDVKMQPALGVLDKALQEQRAGDRTRKAARQRVGQIRDLGLQPGVVGRPQRHVPQRIVF